MKACIDEIKEVEQKAKDLGKKPEFSQLCRLKILVDLRSLWASGEGNFLPATVFAYAFMVAFLVSSDEELSL